jgi:hypothetical protein
VRAGGAKPDPGVGNSSRALRIGRFTSRAHSPLLASEKPGIALALFWIAK